MNVASGKLARRSGKALAHIIGSQRRCQDNSESPVSIKIIRGHYRYAVGELNIGVRIGRGDCGSRKVVGCYKTLAYIFESRASEGEKGVTE